MWEMESWGVQSKPKQAELYNVKKNVNWFFFESEILLEFYPKRKIR